MERTGVKRYITGLNEFAPEVRLLPDVDREARVKQIRAIVAQLEKELASNIIDPNDEQFWNKVKFLKPENDIFWSKIKIRCGNDPRFLEPEKDPYDLIILYAIEAGGFTIVARSLEEARNMPTPPKFYLDKLEETASTVTEVKKLRNKAGAELDKLFTKNQNKLFYVAKILDANSTQYRKDTPHDIIYENMDKFISGELVDKDKKRTAERFLEAVNLDMESLKIRAMVKDANFYKIIAIKSDGYIYHLESGSLLGKNPSEVVEYLKNPLNEQTLADITRKVEKYWNQ